MKGAISGNRPAILKMAQTKLSPSDHPTQSAFNGSQQRILRDLFTDSDWVTNTMPDLELPRNDCQMAVPDGGLCCLIAVISDLPNSYRRPENHAYQPQTP